MPNGSLKDANRDYERRHLDLSEMLDGMYAVDGMLDPEGGSLLRSALDALMGPPQRATAGPPPSAGRRPGGDYAASARPG